MASSPELSTLDYRALVDELRAQNYSMQAGFNAYAQAVKYHSLTLARVETEVEGLKQAKTENDVVTGELQQANTVKGLRIDELETKMNKLLEGKDQQKLQEQHDVGPSVQSTAGVELEDQNSSLKQIVEEKKDEITELQREIAQLKARKTEKTASAKSTVPTEDTAKGAKTTSAAVENPRSAREQMTEREKITIDLELMEALGQKSVKKVKELIANGADVNTKYDDNFTPLIWSAEHGHLKLVKVLIANGANVNATDSEGSTALMAAAHISHSQIAKTLIVNGANVNAADSNGKRGLFVAAASGCLSIVEVLIANSANVDARDRLGGTALLAATVRGRVEVVNALINSGASLQFRDFTGFTALDHARHGNRTQIAELLKAADRL